MRALRAENGCPWDREQDHKSLRRYLLEESYEVLEALDSFESTKLESVANLKEELGDLLFQVLLHAQIAEEKNLFSFDQIAEDLAKKLVRRHPHVFGGEKLNSPAEVLEAWDKNKAREKPKDSVLDGLPPLPALQKALKVIEKVSRVGFQWPNLEGPLQKLEEELLEFKHELSSLGEIKSWRKQDDIPESAREKIESELGDLLFSIANVAHFLNINPEDSLRAMLARFEKRFRYVETSAKRDGKELTKMSLEEMDKYWAQAKKLP